MAKSKAHVVTDMLIRQYNERDITAVDDYIAENHIDHNPTPGQEPGRAGVRKLIQNVIDNSDPKVEIHSSICEGDLVATRYTLTTTHKTDFFGVPAAGKTTVCHIMELDRVENGQIVESWGEFNALEVLGQLGALPEGLFGGSHG